MTCPNCRKLERENRRLTNMPASSCRSRGLRGCLR